MGHHYEEDNVHDEIAMTKKQIARDLVVPEFKPKDTLTSMAVGLNRQRFQAAVSGGEVPEQAYERERLLVDTDILKGLSSMLSHDLTPGGHFYACNCGEYGGHGSGREKLDGGTNQIEHFEQLAKAILRKLHALGVFPTSMIAGKPTIMVTRNNFTLED